MLPRRSFGLPRTPSCPTFSAPRRNATIRQLRTRSSRPPTLVSPHWQSTRPCKDYQDLVTGTDEASYLASAKKISDLYARAEGKAPKPDPVPGSGNRSGDNNPAGGSLASGRELYAQKHKKTS
jgi:hypothetical protein